MNELQTYNRVLLIKALIENHRFEQAAEECAKISYIADGQFRIISSARRYNFGNCLIEIDKYLRHLLHQRSELVRVGEVSRISSHNSDALSAADSPVQIYEADDPQESTYDNYQGSYAQNVEGYDDQTIDSAFDGDPSYYWNID